MIKHIARLILVVALLLIAGCKEKEDIIWPRSVSIVPADTTITVGSSIALKPVFEPEEARLYNNRYFNSNWFSSDPAIANVATISGVVTGIAPGTATISIVSGTSYKSEEGYWVTTIGNSCEVHVIDNKLDPKQ